MNNEGRKARTEDTVGTEWLNQRFVLVLCLPNWSCASILTNTGCAKAHQAWLRH